jgi:glucose/arabinose dehydrogenase
LRRIWEGTQTTLGGFDAAGVGLGGFTLDVQHAYDPIGGQFYAGDGTRRVAATLPDVITRWAGTGHPGFAQVPVVDGRQRTQAIISDPGGIVVAPDGSVFVTDRGRGRVLKISAEGIVSTVAGTGTAGFNGDSGIATQVRLSNPYGLARAPDGTLYVSDPGNGRVRRVTPDGIMRTIAGDGSFSFAGDNGPAAGARFRTPQGLGLGPDGSLYIVDQGNNRIRRIGPDGIITTVAGNDTLLALLRDDTLVLLDDALGIAPVYSAVPFWLCLD